MDLLTELRNNKLIDIKTIVSLFGYGFDSNQTLNALDFDSDLSQMTDISIQQKSVLKQVLNELKQKSLIDSIINSMATKVKANKELIPNESKLFDTNNEDMNNTFEQLNQLFDTNSDNSYSEEILKNISNRLSAQLDELKDKISNKEDVINCLLSENNSSIESSDEESNQPLNGRSYDCSQNESLKKATNTTPKHNKSLSDYYLCWTDHCDGIRFNRLSDCQKHIRTTHFNANNSSVLKLDPTIQLNRLSQKQIIRWNGMKNRYKTNRSVSKPSAKRLSLAKPVTNEVLKTLYTCFTDNCGQRCVKLSDMQNHIQSKHL